GPVPCKPRCASWASARTAPPGLSLATKGGGLEAALNWAMDHSQDADFDLPPQQLQQQQQKQKTAGFEPNPEALATIVSMGFTQEQASRALSQTDNNPNGLGLLALLQKPPSLADLLLGERSLAPTRDLPPPSGESTAASGSSRGVSAPTVELGLRRSDLVMIHGPPGTGKTTTVVELVRQLFARGETIAVLRSVLIRLRIFSTNNPPKQVDNLAERLIASGVRCVRLARIVELLPDVRADIDKLLSGGRKSTE
uniref:UBA domain-containing protein n=1 Tax=Macrostomum lignano TaxID=282301 RepID=A0A1I8F6F0_9PLAT